MSGILHQNEEFHSMFTSILSQWGEAMGDLLVMRACLSCHTALVRQEKFVCIDCLEGLDHTDFHTHPHDNEMYKRIAGKVPLKAAYAMAWFDKGGTLQHILQALKYSRQPEIGIWLGRLYGSHLSRLGYTFSEDTCLVPVPLHWRKHRKRGYNQALKICEGLALETGLRIQQDVLKRVKHTKTQTKMSGARRYQNMNAAFKCQQEWDFPLLLVDDVMTTGATIEACINTLLMSSPEPREISILCLGVARG